MTDEEYERFLAETWERVHELERVRKAEYAAAPDRRFAIWRDLHELSSGALRQLAADFGAEVVGGDAGAMLASAGKDASIFLGCLEAIGQKDAFLTYASEQVDGLGARHPELRPLLAFDGHVLPCATVAHVKDTFGDLSSAREALEKGWVVSRECCRPKGAGDYRVDLSIRMLDAGREAYSCEAFATFDLSSGSFWGFQCSECGCDDGEGFCECEHGATLALAFLLDPASFAGCPERLVQVGDSHGV